MCLNCILLQVDMLRVKRMMKSRATILIETLTALTANIKTVLYCCGYYGSNAYYDKDVFSMYYGKLL